MMMMAIKRFISPLDYSPAIMVISALALSMVDELRGGIFFTRKLASTWSQIKDFGRLFFQLTPSCFSGIFFLEILGDRSTVGQRTLTP
jgi:hypothetical protein